MRLVQSLLPLAAIFGFPVGAFAVVALSPIDVQSTFGTGKPFSSSTPSGLAYTIVLNSDGTASRTPRKGKAAITGTWRISKGGYCSTWAKSQEHCYRVEKDADRYKVVDGSGSPVAYWTIK